MGEGGPEGGLGEGGRVRGGRERMDWREMVDWRDGGSGERESREEGREE